MSHARGLHIRDDIVRARIAKERAQFIASIPKDQICKLASSYRGDMPCYHFAEHKRGCYNICFFVAFDDGEKWVVRVPVAPCLAFEPKSKAESEIATMQYASTLDITSQYTLFCCIRLTLVGLCLNIRTSQCRKL